MTLQIFTFGSKDNFETLTGRIVSDKQWNEIIDEVNGRVENFLDAMFDALVETCIENTGVFNTDIQDYVKSAEYLKETHGQP